MEEVLILNRNYYAIHVADWKKVMCLLFKGHAKVLTEDYNSYDFDQWKDLSQSMSDNPAGFVQAVNFRIAIPEVIVLTLYDELPKMEVRFTRKNIYKHYGYKCCYCGKRHNIEDLTLDHVAPRAQGGGTSWINIVLACYGCNSMKANRTPLQAGMKMHYQPVKPQWRPSYAVKITSKIKVKTSWKKYIDEIYWNVELEQSEGRKEC